MDDANDYDGGVVDVTMVSMTAQMSGASSQAGPCDTVATNLPTTQIFPNFMKISKFSNNQQNIFWS